MASLESVKEKADYWMSRIAKLAQDAPKIANVRIMAAVIYKNELISIETNSKKSDPFQLRFSTDGNHHITLHAETNAIKKADRQLTEKEMEKSVLYISRVKHVAHNHDLWTWGNAAPCIGCRRAISTYNLKRVVYSTEVKGEYVII